MAGAGCRGGVAVSVWWASARIPASWFSPRIVDCTRSRSSASVASPTDREGPNTLTRLAASRSTVVAFITNSMLRGCDKTRPHITNLSKQTLNATRTETATPRPKTRENKVPFGFLPQHLIAYDPKHFPVFIHERGHLLGRRSSSNQNAGKTGAVQFAHNEERFATGYVPEGTTGCVDPLTEPGTHFVRIRPGLLTH